MTWKVTRRLLHIREAKGKLEKCEPAVERIRRSCKARQWHRNG